MDYLQQTVSIAVYSELNLKKRDTFDEIVLSQQINMAQGLSVKKNRTLLGG
jgi:hypothetical protein